ncbi:MAG: hypothetical protein IIB19_05995, partial [Chloroflexi bacterium]|nr:hypothetical protein [Chloroflexota bacterium]
VYAPTLTFWFMHDDFTFLRGAQTASDPWVWVRESLDFRSEGPPEGFGFYRPLYQAGFLGFYKLFGLEAWAYHLLSVSLHLVNVTLVWLIARKLTNRLLIAHGAALIFGLHPAYPTAVAWITAGNSVLATVAYLGSLWLFLKHLDGGPRRLWYYGASLLAFVVALLFHPETLVLTALIVLAYGLLYARSIRDLLAVWSWLRLAPFIVTAIAYYQIQSWVRDHSFTQTTGFGIGDWFDVNYVTNMALAIFPQNLDTTGEFIAASVLVLVSVIVALTHTKPNKPYAAIFVGYWLFLWFLPLSTPILGVHGRKLYSAGPALAIMVAMFGATLWDARPRRLGGWATGLAFVLVVMLMSAAIWHGNEPRDKTRSRAVAFKHLVEQVRDEHPSLPPGTNLYIVNVPGQLLIGGDRHVRNAVRLYFGDVEVRVFPNETALMQAVKLANDDVVLRYRDPLRPP